MAPGKEEKECVCVEGGALLGERRRNFQQVEAFSLDLCQKGFAFPDGPSCPFWFSARVLCGAWGREQGAGLAFDPNAGGGFRGRRNNQEVV